MQVFLKLVARPMGKMLQWQSAASSPSRFLGFGSHVQFGHRGFGTKEFLGTQRSFMYLEPQPCPVFYKFINLTIFSRRQAKQMVTCAPGQTEGAPTHRCTRRRPKSQVSWKKTSLQLDKVSKFRTGQRSIKGPK